MENRYLKGKEFQEYMPLLQQLKPALTSPQLILGAITENNREFIKEKLLPFFNCCKRYKLNIDLEQKDISAFIASLLQLPSLESSVGIEFNDNYCFSSGRIIISHFRYGATSLPIEAILNWLHKPAAVGSNKATGEKRYLRINLSNIENMSEMVEHLKKVASRNFF